MCSTPPPPPIKGNFPGATSAAVRRDSDITYIFLKANVWIYQSDHLMEKQPLSTLFGSVPVDPKGAFMDNSK